MYEGYIECHSGAKYEEGEQLRRLENTVQNPEAMKVEEVCITHDVTKLRPDKSRKELFPSESSMEQEDMDTDVEVS